MRCRIADFGDAVPASFAPSGGAEVRSGRGLAGLRWLVPMLVATVATLGCASVPPTRRAVRSIEIKGNDALGDGEILERIATSESRRFLGLFQGVVYDYELFNALVLERDLARIQRLYRSRGYYQARVRAGRVRHVGDDRVHVEVLVEEGPVVRTRRVEVEGEGLSPQLLEELVDEARSALPEDDPFEEERFEEAESTLRTLLTDAGHAYARVTRHGAVDVVRGEAHVLYRVRAGPKAEFGEVTIIGNGELPEERIRLALAIEPGDPYSTAATRDGKRALEDLGVFSSVDVQPRLGGGPGQRGGVPRVPLVVRVFPARLRTAKLGGGIQLDALKSDVHAVGGWQSKNFLGGMRTFTVSGRAGLVLYPLRVNNFVAPSRPLPEGAVHLELRQPGLFEGRTTGYLAPSASVYAVLLKTDPSPDDPVIGYFDLDVAAGLERRWGRLLGALEHHVTYARPFSYIGDIDPRLSDVVLSYPELAVQLDLRDDPAAPRAGVLLETRLQSAFLGDARDVQVIPEVRGYVPLGRELSLAARTRVGFLFPFNYGDTIAGQLDDPFAERTRAEVRDLQLMFFRGLFAGGTSSNRGYPPRTIAPHAIVPFLNPLVAAEQAFRECDRDDPDFDPARCSVPIGGFTLWEASLELRFPIAGALGGATFCDAADVAPGRVQFRFDHPHLACGLGARYVTPLGALRVDVGYRIPGVQFPSDADPVVEGDPGDIAGAPINISIGIGEAY